MKRAARASAAFAMRCLLGLSFVLVAAPADAQLDPLLFLKRARPTVLIALDLSSRMQRDGRGVYYDPFVFDSTGADFEATLGVGATTERYRRQYSELQWAGSSDPTRATADTISIVENGDPRFPDFDGFTRLGRAEAAIRRVVETNVSSVRFGLVTSRQSSPRIDTNGWQTIAITGTPTGGPTDTGVDGRWRAGIPVVDDAGSGPGSTARVVPADSATANAEILRLLTPPDDRVPSLLAAGRDSRGIEDRPLGLLLDDARAEALRIRAADASCANTVVILVAAGGDPSLGPSGLGDRALTFANLAGHRVRLHVVALAPAALDAAQLRLAAEQGGGQYVEVAPGDIERTPPGQPVPEIVRALNIAVQHAFALSSDYDTPSGPAQPAGPPSYFATSAPVVGTVNLENATDATGAVLPDTRVTGPSGAVLPQFSNVVFTAGFELPGFGGRLAAFRVYRPVADAREAGGYRFSADGTRIWTAKTPVPDVRNVFAIVPGLGLLPFDVEHAAALAPYLGVASPERLIATVRSLPLGPIVHSTPALLEPPSMPFPDLEYADFVQAHRRRRAILFAGADDGMMHGIDARTGVEVWAVIPFNLLPKLHLLDQGRPIDAFPFLLDGSPRLADVKVNGTWRSYLLFGEGPGGTFYQAFDVTLDRIADTVAPNSDAPGPLLAWFSRPGCIPFAWSFPSYGHFDPAIAPWGDVSASATEIEKSVGESWSTPAVGRAGGVGRFVAIVGSGPLAASRERQANRGGVRAGTRVYLLDMASGLPLDSVGVDSDGEGEDQDACPADGCRRLKNALQADPVSVGPRGTMGPVYVGDLDGRLWRIDVDAGAESPRFAAAPRLIFRGGPDQPIFGSVAAVTGVAGLTYLFLATGSDLLLHPGEMPAFRLLGLQESPGQVERRFERFLRQGGAGMGEAASGAATVAGGVAFFATTTIGGGTGCEPAGADVYALTLRGVAAYDTNGDGRTDDRDSPVVAHLRGRATAPVVAARHVFISSGDRLEVLGDPQHFNAGPGFLGVRILSWREVR